MIRFDRDTYITLLYWHGGVIKHIIGPWVLYISFLTALWSARLHYPVIFCLVVDGKHFNILLTCLVFLYVFRVSQTVARHRSGASCFLSLFGNLKSVVTLCCTTLHGADARKEDAAARQELTEMTIMAKVNCIRFVLAFAVSLVMHCDILDSTENKGELDDESIAELLFCYRRLRQLLYAGEMEIVDRALRVSYDCNQGTFSSELACFRMNRGSLGETVLGQAAPTDGSANATGTVVAPLPEVITSMMVRVLLAPIEEPWGYPQRMMNVMMKLVENILGELSNINTVCTITTSLAYVQLSHVLLTIFCVLFPFSIDADDGTTENIVVPALIFFVITGFESLAKMMETPTGHDSTDLNFMEMVHGLEVYVQYVFDVSERDAEVLNRDLMRPMRAFRFSCANDAWPEDVSANSRDAINCQHQNDRQKRLGRGDSSAAASREASSSASQAHPLPIAPTKAHLPPRHFDYYFHWRPIPRIVVESVLKAHAHVTYLNCFSCGQRQFGSEIFANSFSSGDRNMESKDSPLCTDPSFFCHYLAYSGVANPGIATSSGTVAMSTEAKDLSAWMRHAEEILEGHPARTLVAQDELDKVAISRRNFFLPMSHNSSYRELQQEDSPRGGRLPEEFSNFSI